MSQFDFGNLTSPVSGQNLIDTYLEPWRDAIYSQHSGTAQPSYATPGLQWIDTSTSPWTLRVFDGSNNIALGTINALTHEWIVGGISVAMASVVNAATIAAARTALSVYSKAEVYSYSEVDALLTLKASLASPAFTGVPTVPLAATGTSSAQAASCAFVQQELAAFTGGGIADYQVFTSSGLWTKPTGLSASAVAHIEAWGAGGGGGSYGGYGSGGGGGGYSERWMLLSALTATVAITVGAGGAISNGNGNPGGNSSFGAYLTAYGGGGGGRWGYGGGGGGALGAGGNDTQFGSLSLGGAPDGGDAGGGNSRFGGGGGGIGGSATLCKGANSFMGGGGGGAKWTPSYNGTGGTSVGGGSGGAYGYAGTAPGGGGGYAAVGARGEVRVTVFS